MEEERERDRERKREKALRVSVYVRESETILERHFERKKETVSASVSSSAFSV